MPRLFRAIVFAFTGGPARLARAEEVAAALVKRDGMRRVLLDRIVEADQGAARGEPPVLTEIDYPLEG